MNSHTISDNHLSVDQQVYDALEYLRVFHVDAYVAIRRQFPETIIFDGSWFDTDAMRVDSEWNCWLADAIEDTGIVYWEDGEPWSFGENS